MAIKRPSRLLVAIFAAGLVITGYSGRSAAQMTAQATDQDVQNKMRVLQQRIDALGSELDSMKKEAKAGGAGDEKKFDKFMKGFFGTFDMSLDDTTKGITQTSAFGWSYANPLNPNSGLVQGPNKGTATGRVGFIPAMSSNGSNVGYRGSHQIANSDTQFIYQVSTALNLAAAPGLNNTWTKSSNVVTGALGLGDTYIGFKNHTWGTIKFGEMFAPYKTSTDRLNPMSGELGDYSTIMGNTGGDNRVEFGTRFDHAIVFNSPVMKGFSFDLMLSPGQNVNYNNITIPLGSSDCAGSNAPGSGNLPIACDDGGFGDAYGGDLKFEMGGLYLTAAYEMHKNVNRNSDGVGSLSPYYNYLMATNSPLLNWGAYNAMVAEYPNYASVAGGSPEYLNDVYDEHAYKFGGQYRFDFGLTIDALYEHLIRSMPGYMEFQNERERIGTYLAAVQNLNHDVDQIAIGWAHAGSTPGDPAGQHNYNAYEQFALQDNQANTYAVSWKHKLDKQLTWYVDAAETINNGNAHYDIGAGGHGIKTDCHDGTFNAVNDYSSAGPTTWGGCHDLGFSTGVTFKF